MISLNSHIRESFSFPRETVDPAISRSSSSQSCIPFLGRLDDLTQVWKCTLAFLCPGGCSSLCACGEGQVIRGADVGRGNQPGLVGEQNTWKLVISLVLKDR